LPRLTKTYWWQMILMRILLAPVLAALGRGAEAATRLDEAERLLVVQRGAGKFPDWHKESDASVSQLGMLADAVGFGKG